MSDIENLLAMDWKNGLLFIAALIIVFVWLIQKWDFVCQRFGIQTKRAAKEEKQDRDIEELKEHAKKTDRDIDMIMTNISNIQTSVDDVSSQLKNLADRVNENERSKLSDRITQSYRYYKSKGQWTTMEKWAFDNLCNAYKAANGDSFIDEVAIPTSKNWEIVDE